MFGLVNLALNTAQTCSIFKLPTFTTGGGLCSVWGVVWVGVFSLEFHFAVFVLAEVVFWEHFFVVVVVLGRVGELDLSPEVEVVVGLHFWVAVGVYCGLELGGVDH